MACGEATRGSPSASGGLAVRAPLVPSDTTTAACAAVRQLLKLPANFPYGLSRTGFALGRRGKRLGRHGQQQLGCQQGALRFPVNRRHGSTMQLHHVQCSFVGSEKAFVFPSPTILKSRTFGRQPPRRQHAGQQPHVVLFLAMLPCFSPTRRINRSLRAGNPALRAWSVQ